MLYNPAYAALKFRPYTDLKHDVNENLRPKGRIFVVELFCELNFFRKSSLSLHILQKIIFICK